jgi:putative endonuclease
LLLLCYNSFMKLFFWKNEDKEKSIGEQGEQIAASYLKKKGFKIIEKNFKNPFGRRLGEIDIIARKNKELIFVEVKTRILDSFDDILPEESITPSKLHKLNKIANFFLRGRHLMDTPYHFDAISIWLDKGLKVAKIKHIDNIFF